MTPSNIALLSCAIWVVLCAPGAARAQAPSSQSTTETEHLVPPQGSAADVPVHLGQVCILSFPERLSPHALAGSSSFEVRPWGVDGVAVRALGPNILPTTVALATLTGSIKVNVTLRLVASSEPALTMVRFKIASERDAFDGQVKAAVAKIVTPLQQSLEAKERALAQKERDIDALIHRHTDVEIMERLIRRVDILQLQTHARNRDHVILHAGLSYVLGDTGYLTFEIQNRSSASYPVQRVRLLSDRRDISGDSRILSTAIAHDPKLVGVVAPGTTARGIVSVPLAKEVLARPLTLQIEAANGQAPVQIDRGLALQ